jgi:hypothetical protein
MIMNKYPTWIFALVLSVFLVACAAPQEEEKNEKATTPEITLNALEGSPAFAEASLTTAAEPTKNDDGSYHFEFNVTGYELGQQTTPASPNGLANSGKGQHIHFIVNNGPYSAHYEPAFDSDKFAEAGNYVVLSFLSRSYHESVKNLGPDYQSYQIMQMNTAGEEEAADLSAPHMFYSRPKGTYKGEDAKKVLLDFFLLNTDLAPNGNKIRATINDTEFMIDRWQPYVIEGAPMGTLTVKLELLDASGNLVPSPFNPVTREVTLAEADAQ